MLRPTLHRPPGLWLALIACTACSTSSKEPAAVDPMHVDRAPPAPPSPTPRGQTADAGEIPMGEAQSGQLDKLTITASSFSARRHGPKDVEVEITWLIENRAAGPLYLLQTQSLEIRDGAPVILDHSSNGGTWQGRPNVIPGFTILTIPGGDRAQYQMTYRLIVPPGQSEVVVVGRFGYSFTQPSPEWQAKKNWKQAAAWQTLVDTLRVTVPIT